MRRIVFFDGNCLLCSRTVRWLAARDARRRLAFATLQGETARAHGLGKYADISGSVAVIRDGGDGTVFLRSDACLEIAASLGGIWKICLVGRLVPRVLRDGIYRLIARNRRRWQQGTSVCEMPGDDLRGRLLP